MTLVIFSVALFLIAVKADNLVPVTEDHDPRVQLIPTHQTKYDRLLEMPKPTLAALLISDPKSYLVIVGVAISSPQ